MKPHRLALTHNLVLNYGLHKHMTVYTCEREKDVSPSAAVTVVVVVQTKGSNGRRFDEISLT
jgi:hypothetical protein